MERTCIQLVGVDLQNTQSLPISILEKCSTLVVSQRFMTQLSTLFRAHEKCEIIPITPLDNALDAIRNSLLTGDVAVLASGDPLFFGIGRRLAKVFGSHVINVFPAVSSMQHAFARFGISWEDAAFLSLHGRQQVNYVGKLLAHPKTAVLTDGTNRPEVVAAELLSFLGEEDASALSVYVAEDLGMDTERLVAGNLFEIAADQFGSLCCMLVLHKPRHELNGPRFGLGEGDICHSRGLITKSEVRAAAIHALGLIPNSILWDVGAGSGSVGLEAARMVPDMLVYAIEKNGEQHRNILNNKSIFDVLNLKLIRGEAPEMLRSLPRPHRIFIGGSGGNLSEIIKVCAAALLPQGRIVVTGVLEKTCKEAPALLHGCGFTVNTHRLDVRRNTYPETEEKVFNPITIVVGQKDD